jgi:hypothetical protein
MIHLRGSQGKCLGKEDWEICLPRAQEPSLCVKRRGSTADSWKSGRKGLQWRWAVSAVWLSSACLESYWMQPSSYDKEDHGVTNCSREQDSVILFVRCSSTHKFWYANHLTHWEWWICWYLCKWPLSFLASFGLNRKRFWGRNRGSRIPGLQTPRLSLVIVDNLSLVIVDNSCVSCSASSCCHL